MPRGGARPNTGGKREGAGRKPAVLPPLPAADGEVTPLAFILSVMRDGAADPKMRLDAAKCAAQYMHLKKGDGGLKDERKAKAGKVIAGKFGASAPPKLVATNR